MSRGLKSANLLNFISSVHRFKSHSQQRSRFAALCAMLAIVLFGILSLGNAQTKASTTTSLAVTSASGPVTSVTSGTVVTLTASVKAGATAITVGQVNFCNAAAKYCTDINLLGTSQLTSAGTATMKFRPGVGNHSYKAVFAGTNADAGSASNASALMVSGKTPTAAAIAWSGSPGNYSLTSAVGAQGGTSAPSGTVSFLDTSFGNAVVATGELGPGVSGVDFVRSETNDTDNQSTSVTVGDFNGDGIPDLAVASYFDGVVSILLGNGDGTFTPAPDSPISGLFDPDSIIVADFNEDGNEDIAFKVGSYNGGVAIYLGNGDGTFTEAPSSPVIVGGPYDFIDAVASGDLNGDGIADLVATKDADEYGPSSVAILLGNGDGTFTPAPDSPVEVGSGPTSIAIADLNGDGIPDLVTANFFDSTATVLLGNGDGTFLQASNSPITVGQFPGSVALGDLNQDGKIDIAIANENYEGGNPGSVSVLLGNGNGTFTQAEGSPVTVGHSPQAVAVGDFNSNGVPDLAVVNNDDDTVTVLMGAGNGEFTPAGASPISVGDWPESIALGDFTGAGIPDIAVADEAVATATVLMTETNEATLTVAGVAPVGTGTHNVEARYGGDSNNNPSNSITVQLTAGVAPLVITPASGTYTTAQTVTITESIPGTTIYYQASGIVNTGGYVEYTGPIQLFENGTESISAYAIENGYSGNGEVSANYTIDINLPAAPTPTFSPAPGSFTGSQQVMITDSANQAAIYYTINGSTGNFGSTLYSGPITVSNSETLVAIAIAPGSSASVPAAGTYFIDSAAMPFIYTVAGNEAFGYGGDGGPATFGELNSPQSAVKDSAGNLYISDEYNNVVRKVTAGTGIISTVAGIGTPGYSGDGGLAANAQFNGPGPMAMDTAGNLYIADLNNSVIRKIAAGTGLITTYAGDPNATTWGDGGLATSAEISPPGSLAIDTAGNLYIAEPYLETIRKITAATGIISTVAGNGSYGFSGDGGSALKAGFAFPYGVAVDSAGDLFIADTDDNVIRNVKASTGIISTVVGLWGNPGFSGDGGPAASAQLNSPQDVAVDTSGNLYIADTYNNRVRKVTASTGIINTMAGNTGFNWCSSLGGDGDPGADASLCLPISLTVDAAGDVYVVDERSRVREVTAPQVPPASAAATPSFSVAPGNYAGSQTVTVSDSTSGAAIYVTLDGTTATTGGQEYNGPITINGSVTIGAVAVAPGFLPSAPTSASYTIAAVPPTVINTIAGSGISGFAGQGGPALSAELASPAFMAVDAAGNVYFSDPSNYVVWKVSAATGTIGIAAGNGTNGNSGNGGPATSAEFIAPEGIAIDSTGNLYIADTSSRVVRRVDAKTGIISNFAGSGTFTTVAGTGDGGPASQAEFGGPWGLALDAEGDLFISDTSDNCVREVSAATGIISTVAGNGKQVGALGDEGPATSAVVQRPEALAIDGVGNLYIATPNVGRVRKVDAGTGTISTVAGDGSPYGSTEDGGAATSAEVNPAGLAVDGAGNLYISNNLVIREVNTTTGIITRFAGNGYWEPYGDGGSAFMASLCNPEGMAFDSVGNLYFADSCNYRIREISPTNPAATPVISLAAGTYVGAQSVTILDSTANAKIYYTTDGSIPTTESSKYTAAILVSASETINAIAVASGYTKSVAATAAYVITPPATPTITWPSPAAINYGAVLSATQLDATSSVPGTFEYSPAAGTLLTAGKQTLSATFTPTDAVDYTTATAGVTIQVNQATPTVTWPLPAAINYGTALSSTQLNATASVPGKFVYSPAAGTVPPAGNDTLSVTFTPADTTDYAQSTATVMLVVNPFNPAPGVGSLSPALEGAGGAAFALTVNGSGFVSSSIVNWGTTALTTQYVSGTQLTAQVPATAIATTGIYTVTVVTSSPGGGTSNSFQFDVDTAGATPPEFTTLTASVTPGSSATYAVTLPSSATNVAVSCLNLPGGAACSYSVSTGTVTITTSSSTPAGTYQVVVVFTETLPGAATAMIFLPILLLPLLLMRRKLTVKGLWFATSLVLLVSLAAAITGCGGGGSTSTPPPPQTHQVISSGTVTLTVQ
ncbi:MAG: FG-GAP-like repeat-containing protein [Terracidiphilus sp.]